MKFKDVKSIIFDMDGVIIETEPLHYKAHKEAMEAYGFELSEEVYNEKIRSKGRRIGYKATLGDIDEALFLAISTKKDELYRVLLDQEDVFNQDALRLIKYLKTTDITLAIGTAAHDGRYVVNHLGLVEYFNTIVTGKDVVNNKPNPEIYLKCLSLLERNADQTIIIEDSKSGVIAGLAAGARVVYVQRETYTIDQELLDHENVYHVQSLDEVITALK
jgi:beta-phosphoglucomutase